MHGRTWRWGGQNEGEFCPICVLLKIQDVFHGLQKNFRSLKWGKSYWLGACLPQYLEKELGPEALRTMGTIKVALDPDNIMNPGKIIPPQFCYWREKVCSFWLSTLYPVLLDPLRRQSIGFFESSSWASNCFLSQYSVLDRITCQDGDFTNRNGLCKCGAVGLGRTSSKTGVSKRQICISVFKIAWVGLSFLSWDGSYRKPL